MGTSGKYNIGIIGAGIAGLTAATMLKKNGYDATIFEASDSVRGIGAGMGLASNAIKAFEYLNLSEAVVSISKPLTDFKICDQKGKPLFSINTERIKKSFGTDNYAVHRTDLHKLLMSKLKADHIFIKKKLVNLTAQKDKVQVYFEDGTAREFDFVIGADGVNSQIRQLLLPDTKPKYAGYWCWRNVVKDPKIDLTYSFATWGKRGRFGVTPLNKDRMYWFACIKSDLKDQIKNYKLKELKVRFKDYDKIIPELLALSKDEDMISGPVLDIDPISKFHFGRILLVGDAAHATTPNMGQGACMAVEDIAVLQDELQKNDFLQACRNFEKRRISRTRYIIKNSRRAGKIAQFENSFSLSIRNALFQNLPDWIMQLPLKRLLKEDFMKY